MGTVNLATPQITAPSMITKLYQNFPKTVSKKTKHCNLSQDLFLPYIVM